MKNVMFWYGSTRCERHLEDYGACSPYRAVERQVNKGTEMDGFREETSKCEEARKLEAGL
jgi:hypothetical protein